LKIEQHQHYSAHLNREMFFKTYGHSGKPMVVFPSSGGRYYEYEDFGMIEACRGFIQSGAIQVFTPDSVDYESWLNQNASPHDKGQMHNRYDRYIVEEFIPTVKHLSGYQGAMIATGCSMGGYHAMNFYLRHPDVFDTTIALSGIYDARFFVGDYGSDIGVYENSPTDYLWNLYDPWFLDKYRRGNIIVCTGQGAWEEPSIEDTRKLEAAFLAKQIPAFVDYWGYDVNHDWPWWRIQIVYFLNILQEKGVI